MKATTNVTIGNFDVTVEADYDAQFLADLGLKWIVQRQTAIDKVLGGFTKNAKGKDERRPGWKRNDVDYSKEIADSLAAVLSHLNLPDSEETLDADVAITEYVREASEKKYADAKGVLSTLESRPDFEAILKNRFKFVGEIHGDDGEFTRDVLVAVDNALKAAKNAMIANLTA